MRAFLALSVLLPLSAVAQTAPPFPLGDTDTWSYGYVISPPNAPPDTTRDAPVTVRGTATVRDTVYTLVTLPGLASDSLRTDAEGRVFARLLGRDQLLLDATLDSGQSYEVTEDAGTYIVTVTRDLTVETPAGRFEDAIRFDFDLPGTVDDERAVTLAPGIGVVQTIGPFANYRELFEARIDGTVLLAGPDEPASPRVRAFPSPFARTLTIELASRGRQRVEVLDALGRTVAVVFDRVCAATCQATWDAEGAAPGVYLIRATTPQGVSSRSVVRAR